MKRNPMALAIATLALAGTFGCVARARAADEAELSNGAQRVVDYLLEDWAKRFRSTSIPLAMANLGMEPDDALRLEIGRHFRAHPELANNLKYWGANNYILSNDEKLIAKYLLNTFLSVLNAIDFEAYQALLSDDYFTKLQEGGGHHT